MTYATDIDSGRLQQIQEDIAIDQRADGHSDAYDGKALLPGMSFDSVRGFIEGLIHANTEQQDRTARFKEFVEREEALHRGEPDWLHEVMESNDEPLLGDEEQEDPDLIVGSEEITYCFPNGKSYVHYFDADTEF